MAKTFAEGYVNGRVNSSVSTRPADSMIGKEQICGIDQDERLEAARVGTMHRVVKVLVRRDRETNG